MVQMMAVKLVALMVAIMDSLLDYDLVVLMAVMKVLLMVGKKVQTMAD